LNWPSCSLREAARTGEAWYDAEPYRRIGEIHRQRGEVTAARRSFAEALRVARGQSAKLWELHTATSFARMLRDHGEAEAAHSQLAPVYAWFSEGFDTAPLLQARALLDDLETRWRSRGRLRYGVDRLHAILRSAARLLLPQAAGFRSQRGRPFLLLRRASGRG
jgi:hypothetical protein